MQDLNDAGAVIPWVNEPLRFFDDASFPTLISKLGKYKEALEAVKKANTADAYALLTLKYMIYLTDQLILWMKLEQKIQSKDSDDLPFNLASEIDTTLSKILNNEGSMSENILTLRRSFILYEKGHGQTNRYFYSTINNEKAQVALWSSRQILLAIACLIIGAIMMSVSASITAIPLFIVAASLIGLFFLLVLAALPNSNSLSPLEYVFFNSIWNQANTCLKEVTSQIFVKNKNNNASNESVVLLIGAEWCAVPTYDNRNTSYFFNKPYGSQPLCEQVDSKYNELSVTP